MRPSSKRKVKKPKKLDSGLFDVPQSTKKTLKNLRKSPTPPRRPTIVRLDDRFMLRDSQDQPAGPAVVPGPAVVQVSSPGSADDFLPGPSSRLTTAERAELRDLGISPITESGLRRALDAPGTPVSARRGTPRRLVFPPVEFTPTVISTPNVPDNTPALLPPAGPSPAVSARNTPPSVGVSDRGSVEPSIRGSASSPAPSLRPSRRRRGSRYMRGFFPVPDFDDIVNPDDVGPGYLRRVFFDEQPRVYKRNPVELRFDSRGIPSVILRRHLRYTKYRQPYTPSPNPSTSIPMRGAIRTKNRLLRRYLSLAQFLNVDDPRAKRRIRHAMREAVKKYDTYVYNRAPFSDFYEDVARPFRNRNFDRETDLRDWYEQQLRNVPTAAPAFNW